MPQIRVAPIVQFQSSIVKLTLDYYIHCARFFEVTSPSGGGFLPRVGGLAAGAPRATHVLGVLEASLGRRSVP